jgi:hypothetical protein
MARYNVSRSDIDRMRRLIKALTKKTLKDKSEAMRRLTEAAVSLTVDGEKNKEVRMHPLRTLAPHIMRARDLRISCSAISENLLASMNVRFSDPTIRRHLRLSVVGQKRVAKRQMLSVQANDNIAEAKLALETKL